MILNLEQIVEDAYRRRGRPITEDGSYKNFISEVTSQRSLAHDAQCGRFQLHGIDRVRAS